MGFTPTVIGGAWIIDLEPRHDDRGWFSRALCQRELAAHGIPAEVRQANISHGDAAGTFRGLHAQVPPACETKVLRCISGALLDVIVDLRPESSTFGHTLSVALTAESGRAIVVPDRCAHGFLSLEDDTRAFYTVSDFYTPADEVGLRWNDPVVNVDWPLEPSIVSSKDIAWPDFSAQSSVLRQRMSLPVAED